MSRALACSPVPTSAANRSGSATTGNVTPGLCHAPQRPEHCTFLPIGNSGRASSLSRTPSELFQQPSAVRASRTNTGTSSSLSRTSALSAARTVSGNPFRAGSPSATAASLATPPRPGSGLGSRQVDETIAQPEKLITNTVGIIRRRTTSPSLPRSSSPGFGASRSLTPNFDSPTPTTAAVMAAAPSPFWSGGARNSPSLANEEAYSAPVAIRGVGGLATGIKRRRTSDSI